MRVRHRWLLLSIFVAAVVIVLAITGSKRTVHSGIAISFLGYTNPPNEKVRFALFAVTNEHPASTHFKEVLVEVDGHEGQNARVAEADCRIIARESSAARYSEICAVGEPLESSSWRLSWVVYHSGLRRTLLLYAAAHGLLRQPLLGSLASGLRAREQSHCVTNSSIWLTNSP